MQAAAARVPYLIRSTTTSDNRNMPMPPPIMATHANIFSHRFTPRRAACGIMNLVRRGPPRRRRRAAQGRYGRAGGRRHGRPSRRRIRVRPVPQVHVRRQPRRGVRAVPGRAACKVPCQRRQGGLVRVRAVHRVRRRLGPASVITAGRAGRGAVAVQEPRDGVLPRPRRALGRLGPVPGHGVQVRAVHDQGAGRGPMTGRCMVSGPDRTRTGDLTLRKRSHYPCCATDPARVCRRA